MTTPTTSADTATSSAAPDGGRAVSAGALWASAAVIFALILVQAGRTIGAPAAMDVVSQSGQYTVLTFDGGNADILVVLDGRGEELFYYQVHQQRRFEFLGRADLQEMFTTARRIGAGGGG